MHLQPFALGSFFSLSFWDQKVIEALYWRQPFRKLLREKNRLMFQPIAK